MHHLAIAGMLALALFLFPACQTSQVDPDDQAITLDRLLGTWHLSTLGGEDVLDLLPQTPAQDQPARVPTLEFGEDGQFSGFAGVNQMSGRLDTRALARGDFASGPIITTRMAGPPQLMQLEQRYTQAIQDTRGLSLRDGDLVLHDMTGDALATLTRQDPRTLRRRPAGG